MFSSYTRRGHKNIQSPYRITPVLNGLSSYYYLSDHLLYSKDTCGYAKIKKIIKNNKKKEGVKEGQVS